MGRHSALMTESNPRLPLGPTTDPHLFDQPVVDIERASEHARRVASAADAGGDPVAGSYLSDLATPTAALELDWDFDDEIVGEPQTGSAFTPVSVRAAAPRGGDRVVPQVASSALRRRGAGRPAQQRYLRTGPIPITQDEPERPPGTSTRKREAVLAAAALAVVGAMSGAAALLPSTASDAQAATKVDPVSTPMPTASGSSSNGSVCVSPQQIKRAMRHHHLKVRTLVQAATVITDSTSEPRTAPSASSTPSASASATPSASATATPTASASRSTPSSPSPASGSGSGSTSSTAPLIDLPGLVGALPMIPSSLRAGTYALNNFVTQSSGAVIAGGKLHGEGVGTTVVAMTKNSSTKASSVPGNGNNQGGLANPVNPLYLLRGVSDLQDVTVQGTQQGHLYNGLYMTGANLVIKHVQVNDIPGNSSANPGETFAIGVNRATGTGTVSDLTINGGSGALSSAVGLAINNSDADWSIDDLTAKNLEYSAGIALWQVRGTMNVRNYVQQGGARSLGAERMAGKVNLYDPRWSAGTTGHDVTYTWDGGYSGGSINFYYSSAAKVPDRKIRIITNHAAGIAGSVHVYIGGVKQNTADYVTVS